MISEAEIPVTQSIHYKVRQESIMVNKEHHEFFLKNGWFVAKNVVKPEEISGFQHVYNQVASTEGFELSDTFLNTGCMVNEQVRILTMDVIRRQEGLIFPRIFKTEMIEPKTGGAFAVKPPHENSELGIHQDASFIDEEKEYSLFIWIPFADVKMQDGPMWFLPGSHLWGNTQRGFGVPWPFGAHEELIKKYMVPLTVNAGDVVVFDPAAIHFSSPNFSDKLRNAISISVVKKDPQIVYYFHDKEEGEDSMGMYQITEDFFKGHDFVSKPDETKWPKKIVPYRKFDMSSEEMKLLIERHLPENQG